MWSVLLLILSLPLLAQDTNSGQIPGETVTFRAAVSDVRVDVQVLDRKGVVTDLEQNDFIVKDNDQFQRVISFRRDAEPLSLVLLLDVSGSVKEILGQIADTARSALNHLQPGDKVAIMVFGRKSAVHLDFNDNHAEVARQIPKAIENEEVGSSTAINAAVLDAAHYIEDHAPDEGHRAILIITDNLSLSFKVPDSMVVDALLRARASCNAIVFGRGIRPAPASSGRYTNPDFTPADVFLLSEQTGGEAIKSSRAAESFREMIERIRLRYTLAYHAPPSVAGSFRRISISLTPMAERLHPGATVLARTGYVVR